MDKTTAQAELLFNRLSKRYRHLKKWAKRTGTNAFRLYDRDIPEIPLVLDLYGDAVSGAVYKRPYEKDDSDISGGEEGIWLNAMKASAARALGISEGNIFLKERRRMRQRQRTGDQYGKVSAQNFYRDANEGDLVFRVNLSDYLDTGLFLDARKRRAHIRAEAAGKRVLNLFAYTCSLSVAAAKGGACQVDSVDLSATYLEWGKINFALNGLGLRSGFNFVKNDVIRFISHARKERESWDLIILDPPSFSNSKKMTGALDLRRDFMDLIEKSLSLLGPGGTLFFSTNAKGVKIDSGDFPNLNVKNISEDLADEDFRGKRIPCCYALSILN